MTDVYMNLKTQMVFKCPNDHENYFTLGQWRSHPECPICKNNPYAKMNDAATKNEGFRILAFDQALNVSGWSVFDNKKLIKFGKQKTEGTDSVTKICRTKTWVANMIYRWKPNLVVFEDIQLQVIDGSEQVVVYKKLASLLGVLQNYCYETGIAFKTVPPATWRAHSQIKGKTRTDKKKNAQLLIKTKYNVNVSQDEADAILIGEWAASERSQKKIVTF